MARPCGVDIQTQMGNYTLTRAFYRMPERASTADVISDG